MKYNRKKNKREGTSIIPVSTSLEKNVTYFENKFSHTADLMIRDLRYNGKPGKLLYLSSLTDEAKVQTFVIEPLLLMPTSSIEDATPVITIQKKCNLVDGEQALTDGYCILFTEEEAFFYTLDTYSPVKRSIEEPGNEQVIRGSHEGFIEHMKTNIHLIRKRINHHSLTIRNFVVGELSNTKISMVYIDGLANQTLIDEVEKRIKAIHVDSVLTPGNIEEFIEDTALSPFPQLLNTERPDRVVGNLLEGRIGILMEGSPTVLVAPVTFFTFYQSPDDYNTRSMVGSFFRLIRVASFIIAILVPAFYISLISFHFEVIPIDMIFAVQAGLINVPFPPFIEAVFMQLTLELLKEAGTRLPRPIAPTIGIVGGLVIGNAVVQANLVSNIMIVVIGITAIASFAVPSNEMSTALRILGFPFMIAAATFGFLGIVFALMLLFMHLSKLESFGTPYFSPFAPFQWRDVKDTIIRLPSWLMNKRPKGPHPKQANQQTTTRGWRRGQRS
ncbi:GerA spore germination protein [Fictibacillus macauensis ZFHKF-1]|uniref:GerA spore germination protein n=1 Tax=Fictibacillus macauensis ZFHKF-1 TaxID=1196324 RepID=I8IYJ4_9BACL|nr:spore germination protein [Fictibacillus macauensis]EIT84541.1 GerA spore germination protein [Fictibacillus macauensis ZFHKF-1]